MRKENVLIIIYILYIILCIIIIIIIIKYCLNIIKLY